ncbi:aKG-HExxH-type peptide beta-hydroxylase [Burkholderia plantarii]|uniref:aKG-HExxH-type peptide beta-hydroxylase n=1 Tax=Burkholderia plantarii TaxID=41899 RepID=UPI0018DD56D6|nr:HEXXH motif-containing putative peptide modification protein [Burkholderia plantarii]MBI0328727.1 HEXXH motif domain-containing protein [Burkholderia plantarii]
MYTFLPDKAVALQLRHNFRSQLKESFVDMLTQLSAHAPEVFPANLVARFVQMDASSYGGFHCFSYHFSIKLAEQNLFEEIARLLDVISSARYHHLPRFVSSQQVDKLLLGEILDQIKLGTTHDAISLIPVADAVEREAVSVLESGIERLRFACPELAFENDVFVRSVVFFESSGSTNERALSFTGDKLQSLVLINAEIERDWIFLLDKLVHEAAHTYLYAINLHEEMVRNPEEDKFSSPLRRDERTMLGIYHATFVIQRLILAFTRILEARQLSGDEEAKITELLAYYHSRLDSGFDTVMAHGDLSDTARRLLIEGQAYARQLRAPSEVDL